MGAKSYAEVREKLPDEATRQLLDQVVGKEDKFVIVGSKKGLAMRYILVRTKGGKSWVAGGPYRVTYLILPIKIADAAAQALAKAEQVELFSLDPNFRKEPPQDSLHGWKILGKTTVKDGRTLKSLRAALLKSVEESDGIAAVCFNPRHAIRVTVDKKQVDFIICFECFQMRILSKEDKLMTGVLLTDTAQPVFDQILRDAGVPLAKKAEE